MRRLFIGTFAFIPFDRITLFSAQSFFSSCFNECVSVFPQFKRTTNATEFLHWITHILHTTRSSELIKYCRYSFWNSVSDESNNLNCKSWCYFALFVPRQRTSSGIEFNTKSKLKTTEWFVTGLTTSKRNTKNHQTVLIFKRSIQYMCFESIYQLLSSVLLQTNKNKQQQSTEYTLINRRMVSFSLWRFDLIGLAPFSNHICYAHVFIISLM